jgi:hypothetical protein
MATKAQLYVIVNARAVDYLTARSPEQAERYLDILTDAVIDAGGGAGHDLRIAVDHAIERARPQRRIRP